MNKTADTRAKITETLVNQRKDTVRPRLSHACSPGQTGSSLCRSRSVVCRSTGGCCAGHTTPSSCYQRAERGLLPLATAGSPQHFCSSRTLAQIFCGTPASTSQLPPLCAWILLLLPPLSPACGCQRGLHRVPARLLALSEVFVERLGHQGKAFRSAEDTLYL